MNAPLTLLQVEWMAARMRGMTLFKDGDALVAHDAALRARVEELEHQLTGSQSNELTIKRLQVESLWEQLETVTKELSQRKGWQHCKTHEKINANYAWGCPDCVHELRQKLQAVESDLVVMAQYVYDCERKSCSPLAMKAQTILSTRTPKFAVTSCSQCGKEFGPGNSGYSHCDQHKAALGEVGHE